MLGSRRDVIRWYKAHAEYLGYPNVAGGAAFILPTCYIKTKKEAGRMVADSHVEWEESPSTRGQGAG
ncbi:hypothetical protein DFAR_3800062 [Desulfarculales bacterium]